MVRELPAQERLSQLAEAYAYRLFELATRQAWLLDLELTAPPPDSRSAVRAVKALVPGYIDAVRVLAQDDELPEQARWLVATATVAGKLGQPVLGFLSDDNSLDFAATATPAGISTIGDRVDRYLLRWEAGQLQVQPVFGAAPGQTAPIPPAELVWIPGVNLLPIEDLVGGYPLHGNVVAEMQGFMGSGDMLGIGTREGVPVGDLRLIGQSGMTASMWDRAAGI
jgi:hypothetical protein